MNNLIYKGVMLNSKPLTSEEAKDQQSLIIINYGYRPEIVDVNQRYAVSRRELHLLLPEVGESMNAFEYAKYLMYSLKFGTITSEEYDLLSGDLQMYCKSNKVETENEICSLF